MAVDEMTGDARMPSRYEIRPLGLEHLEWTKALFAHSFIFGSPIWRALYPHDRTARFYGLYQSSHLVLKHQLASGLSLGIFDTEYVFRNPDSAATGGALYLDPTDVAADEEELLRQMDTPLVSIACAFDAFFAIDPRHVAPVMARLPACISFYDALEASGGGEGGCKAPSAPGQVLQRMGTATRADAEGAGLMRALAYYMMRRAAEIGFRHIRIDCLHDAVAAVWSDPPSPFTATVACEVDACKLELELEPQKTLSPAQGDERGTRKFPRQKVRQRLAKVYVTLC
ncbi:hypothetical protein GGS20DRAFT_598273 [Poronia punctata]|nr:hypothetical protein GGS20DRAFT_598273 [Poronia punctata]